MLPESPAGAGAEEAGAAGAASVLPAGAGGTERPSVTPPVRDGVVR